MVEGSKLTALDDIGVALAQTDLLYVVRGSGKYRAAISRLRILAAQISDAGATGLDVLAAATPGDVLALLSLGALSLLDTVGTTEIDDESVTVDKMADLSEDAVLIGDVADRPIELPTGATGRDLMGAADPASARTVLELGPETDVTDAVDDESVAYTGQDNAQVGSVYATVADLNALRVAYEDLRARHNSICAIMRTLDLMA